MKRLLGRVRISGRQLGVEELGLRSRRNQMRWFSEGRHETPEGRTHILCHLAEKNWATDALLLEVVDVLKKATRRGQKVFDAEAFYSDRARDIAREE